jgi:hypothetical protein
MADENVKIHDLAANATRAENRLYALRESGGEAGVAQRAFKGGLQRTAQAPMPGMMPMGASTNGAAEAVAGLSMGSGVGGGYGYGGEKNFAEDAQKELVTAAQNLRNVGNRTFYQREGRWIDSQVTKNQEANAKRVKQFSEEYFEIARRYGKTVSQYLVFDEPVLLNLDNQAYLIEP